LIDIDEVRNAHIKMYGLSKADEAYTFYHDETNNIKKLRLDAQGMNVAEPAIFVLGGVVHEGAPRPRDIQPLRDAMRIQKSADEIKLKHVAKGNFLDLLRSDKLTTFLKWLSDNGLVIHYHALDPIYWSLVDIMDSILGMLGETYPMQVRNLLKADLATLLRANLPATATIFFRYNYPDLAPESRKPFLDELLAMMERSDGVLPEFNAMMLKGMLQAGRNLPSLDFIEGYSPHVLIENFAVFYLTRIAVFKYSSHVLDMEDSIRDEIEAMKPSCNGLPVTHYRFADSKSEHGIQISDVVVGLVGKMHTYLSQTPRAEVAAVRASLSGKSLKNAELMRDLIDASHEANIAFLTSETSKNSAAERNFPLRTRLSDVPGCVQPLALSASPRNKIIARYQALTRSPSTGVCVSDARGSTVEARGAEDLHTASRTYDPARAAPLHFLRKGASERERLGLYVAAFHVFGQPALLFLEAGLF